MADFKQMRNDVKHFLKAKDRKAIALTRKAFLAKIKEIREDWDRAAELAKTLQAARLAAGGDTEHESHKILDVKRDYCNDKADEYDRYFSMEGDLMVNAFRYAALPLPPDVPTSFTNGDNNATQTDIVCVCGGCFGFCVYTCMHSRAHCVGLIVGYVDSGHHAR